MSLIDEIKKHAERLRSSPGDELGRWARLTRFQIQLWRFCARRLWQNNLTAMSAALSFRTIFALIPIIVLTVLILKSLGVVEDGKLELRRFLEGAGFAPIAVVESSEEGDGEPTMQPAATQKSVADEIVDLVERVESKLTIQRLGPVGAVLLVWTALTLLTTMERSLNRVFGAVRPRPLFRRLLLYWSVLTLGPIVLVSAGYLGRKLVSSVENIGGISWLLTVVGWVGPAVVGILVLAAIYKLLPHTNVRYRAAVGGAFVSVPLWLLAKWGFSVYVTKLVGGGNLYGALGLLPLFLIWVNLSWLIFLFGAELANTAANLDLMQQAEKMQDRVPDPLDMLAVAVAVAQPYARGEGPVSVDVVRRRLNMSGEVLSALLDRLTAAGVVCPVEGEDHDSYLPARPAERIPILQIVGLDSQDGGNESAHRYAPEIAEAIVGFQERTRRAMPTFALSDVLALCPASDERATDMFKASANAD